VHAVEAVAFRLQGLSIVFSVWKMAFLVHRTLWSWGSFSSAMFNWVFGIQLFSPWMDFSAFS